MLKGLGNLGNIASLIKQAQQFQGKMDQLTEQLRLRRAQGVAGGGLVSAEVNGLGEVLRCQIDPSLIAAGDRELIEDLLPAAINQALAKAKEMHADEMKSLAGGMGVPGLDNMLAELTGGDSSAGTS